MHKTKEERSKCKGVLAIDFDDTIAEIKGFPNIAGPRPGAKEYINKLYEEGFFIIIWTCRNKQNLIEAEEFLKTEEIKYHTVNQQHPYIIERYNGDTRKISCCLYIDDKGLVELPHWKEIYNIIHQRLEGKMSCLQH